MEEATLKAPTRSYEEVKGGLWRNCPQGHHDLHLLGFPFIMGQELRPLNGGVGTRWHAAKGNHVLDEDVHSIDAVKGGQQVCRNQYLQRHISVRVVGW